MGDFGEENDEGVEYNGHYINLFFELYIILNILALKLLDKILGEGRG